MKHYFLKVMKEHLSLMRKNGELFFGIAFFFFGTLGFSNGKYCDGNPADYYSCTNPETYYYYGSFAIALTVIGAFFVALWFLKRSER